MTPRRQVLSSSATQNIRKHKPDYLLVVLTSILLGLGIIVIVAISPALTSLGKLPGSYYVFRQLISMVLGLGFFFACSKFGESFYRRTQRSLIMFSLVASGAVLAISGVANRWIQIGGFSFQPVELIKFTVIIVVGLFLSDRMNTNEEKNFKKTLYPIGLWLALTGFIVVVLQRDLGSMVVIIGIIFTMLLLSGAPLNKLIIAGLAIAGIIAIAIASTPYRRDRFMTFLQPERDCSSEGYHACQALIAVGSGGLMGLGLGNSVQAYGYLPEASNDSIFAIYAEKFGFMGSLILVIIYGTLLYRILLVVKRAGDIFSRLVASGVFAWFAVQAFINIGAMVGLLPLKGITLPFVSYGGTSLVFVLAGLGVVYRASSYTVIRRSVNSPRGV